MDSDERRFWFEHSLIAGSFAALGAAGLIVVYVSGLAHQALVTGWVSIVVGAMVFLLLPLEARKEPIRLSEVGLWLFGFMLDLAVLIPGALCPAKDFQPQPHADVASTSAGVLFFGLVAWLFYAVRHTSDRGLLPFIIAILQLWLGFVGWALSSMAISGSWL